MRVVIAVDQSSTRALYEEFAEDLDRLRAGRYDHLRPPARRLMEAGTPKEILCRLSVVRVDVDRPSDAEVQHALRELETVLEDPKLAAAAWAVLVEDASEMCARRGRRTRDELVALLAAQSIKVTPPPADASWARRLDATRDLLKNGFASAALAQLEEIARDLDPERRRPGAPAVALAIHARLWQQRSAALRMLDRHVEALDAAQHALDFEPTNIHALKNAAISAMLAGEPDIARQFVARAIATAPDDADTWGMSAQVAAGLSDPPSTAPARIADHPDYLLALANISTDAGDWPRVLELMGRILQQGRRPREVLFFRTRALISLASPATSINTQAPADRASLAEADRLATELLDALPSPRHRLYVRGLVLRAEARRLLGRTDDAAADLLRAKEVDPNDPDAIGNLAQARLRDGDTETALELLRHPSVDDHVSLMLLRARAQIETDDDAGARYSLQRVLSNKIEGTNADRLRMVGAEVALAMDDADLAAGFLEKVSPSWRAHDPYTHVCLGRLAFLRGDVQEGVRALD